MVSGGTRDKANNKVPLISLVFNMVSGGTRDKVIYKNRWIYPLIRFFQSFVDAAHALKERGAYKIYALATHGILSADAPRLIEESPINEVIRIFLQFRSDL